MTKKTTPTPSGRPPATRYAARGTKTSTRAKATGASKKSSDVSAQTSPAPIPESTANPHSAQGPVLHDKLLGLLADVVDDLEGVRKANENRLRTLTDTSEYGFGLTLDNPDVARLAQLVNRIKTSEADAIKQLQRTMRRHPLWPWAKDIKGVGEKQFARLLASIRDPYWNDLHERPRKLRELRAYCGYHVLDYPGDKDSLESKSVAVAGVAPKHLRGQQGNWNDKARMRAWLIATQLIILNKDGKYRKVYDEARLKYADSLHPSVCVRCGPKGKPAQLGSPRSDAHCHAMALRKVAVEFLNDLWAEAKTLHETSSAPALSAPAKPGSAQRTKTSTRAKGDPDSNFDRGVSVQTFPAPSLPAKANPAPAQGTKTSTRAKVLADSSTPSGVSAQTSPAPSPHTAARQSSAQGSTKASTRANAPIGSETPIGVGAQTSPAANGDSEANIQTPQGN